MLIKSGTWTKFSRGKKLKPKKTEDEMIIMNLRSLRRTVSGTLERKGNADLKIYSQLH